MFIRYVLLQHNSTYVPFIVIPLLRSRILTSGYDMVQSFRTVNTWERRNRREMDVRPTHTACFPHVFELVVITVNGL